jgi:radical SAM protein with 4Fe4S-binding SPASM domain
VALLGDAQPDAAGGDHVPHVVAWNLTRRCNLECAHCYIAAGPAETAADELTTAECLRIADEILALNPAPMFILSGGEPLLRDDLETIAAHGSTRGATVVVGTNGTLLTDERIARLRDAGVRGVAVSVESRRPEYHDRFRRGHGSLRATLDAVDRLGRHGMDFVVQTTVTRGNRDELGDLVGWAADRGAVAFNAYFLVAAGRGARLTDLAPDEYERALTELVDLHVAHLGRMMVRAKCAPQFMRLVHQRTPDSPILNYRTRCPCGVQYCRVTPDGKLTACPYLPEPAGDLRARRFADVWRESPLFAALRGGTLGGRCGRCEYRALCGGCRARAFGATGDVLSEDPSCTHQPDGVREPIAAPRPVTYGSAAAATMTWSDDARARMERVPSFVRGVVMRRVEDYARSQGRHEVTADLLAEVRSALPVDFSKRLPFFLRQDHGDAH